MANKRLSHVDARGRVKMVDVGDKPVTTREAIARGSIRMSAEALRLIRAGAVKKGDPLQTARLAGIMAAKRTSEIVPLCHPLPLTHVDVELTPHRRGYTITARVGTVDLVLFAVKAYDNPSALPLLPPLLGPDTVVLDLGAGTGVHGLMAARMGARRVYLVEPEDIISVAEEIAEANGLRDRVRCIQGRIEDVSLPEPC